MLIHDSCHSSVLANVTGAFLVLAEVEAQNKDSFRLQKLHLHLKETKVNKYVLTCSRCGTVEVDDVLFQCRCCGNITNLKDAKIPRESGGMVCRRCYDKFTDEPLDKFTDLLSNPIFIE